MKKYLLIDTSNMFWRSRHAVSARADSWTKVGMSLHITFNSILKCANLFEADHVIFCLEARSWRKDHTTTYKANRTEVRAAMNQKEQEEDKLFWETYEVMVDYLNEHTNCSVVRVERAEADDLIARWIYLHPYDKHIIVSNDSDFHQLLAPNVEIYNGVASQIVNLEGYWTDNRKPVIDKKTNEHKKIGDPAFILFEKCMRGDTSDNIFTAYPGVRTKGTAKKVGLTEAFVDMEKKGFAWNNMMLQRWTDHNGVEHRVLDRYEANRELIDLKAQPQDIKDAVDTALLNLQAKNLPQVGAHFMKFCGKYDLERLSQSATKVADILNRSMPKEVEHDRI